MKFLYVCQNVNSPSFVSLTSAPGSQDDKVLTISSHNQLTLRKKIVDYLNYGENNSFSNETIILRMVI